MSRPVRMAVLLLPALILLVPAVSPATTRHIYVDNNAVPPGNGSQDQPYPTISAAMRPGIHYPAGDVIIVHVGPGTYRESVAKSGWIDENVELIIEGSVNPRPVIKGSDLDNAWAIAGGATYVTPWNYDFYIGYPPYSESNLTVYTWYYGEDPNNTWRAEFLSHREGVWIDGERLIQALSASESRPGTFLVDQDNDRLFVWLQDGGNPADHQVELAVREYGVNFYRMGKITLRNLVFNHCRDGIYASQCASLTVDSCLIEENVNDGIAAGQLNAFTVSHSYAHANGYNGIQPSYCYNIDVHDSGIVGNNWRGAYAGAGDWLVAGMKLYAVSGISIRNVTAASNLTCGIWFDRYSDTVEIDSCRLIGNYGSGLFWEISPGPIAINNCEFRDNGLGLRYDPALHTTYSGLLINSAANLSASDCVFDENLAYNVRIANSGRTAELWKAGDAGFSDPIVATNLKFERCVFYPDLTDRFNISVPDFLNPDWFWAHAITLPPDTTTEQPPETDPDAAPSLGAFPNPAVERMILSITLPQGGDLHVALYDVLGRLARSYDHRGLPAGEHQTAIDGAGLANGIYFLRVYAGGHELAPRKLMFLK